MILGSARTSLALSPWPRTRSWARGTVARARRPPAHRGTASHRGPGAWQAAGRTRGPRPGPRRSDSVTLPG
eukprot:359016-Hanusia_phi.AAC.1